MKPYKSKQKAARKIAALLVSHGALLGSTACTQYKLDSFRYAQQNETYAASQDINTKVDLLWVIDNSASMDVSQQRLRAGLTSFANTYLKPTWDMRIAVITTDTYLANSKFSSYLNSTVSGSVNWTSTYLTNHKATWVNPSWNTSLFNTSTGRFTNGFKYNEMVPAWGALGLLYSRLLPGIHDGPITGLCSESTPTAFFYAGSAHCSTRDLRTNTGTSHCLNPSGGESSVTQCVNTIQNDTVHSGKAILSTMPPSGVQGNQAWIDQLVDDFMVNATTGSAGHGSERGLASVIQMLNDNESTSSAFFRAGSTRGIIFLSDEEDQSMDLPATPPAGFSPNTYYSCDAAGVTALNGANTFCCAGGSCTYGSYGTTCPSKTIDGYTYTVSVCPDSTKLTPVATIKTQIDNFFTALDGTTNYFVVSIVPTTAASIQSIQADRVTEENGVGSIHLTTVDRGDRYIALGNLVGNGSFSMDLGATDYSPILDAIGQAVLDKKSTFTLARAPTSQEEMIVQIIHQSGASTVLTANQYSISGTTLKITDRNVILNLSSTDKININYQPTSL